ncbi:central glycolytic pathway regulator [Tetragenococcus muriaticus PMC-11-5]|uniref:Central glycolytic pathway regulator n=1 Tax=Tetragenococcus muriaticus PMC-11-5 TaxID=1302649 RepID=A0A091BYK9_9ENTE|nr:sugar-binding domain-containing protein [Tetragenococcus muriaticus]KFN90706.1 central glycolytic pathway regulator [Tetragenococcus muriaticus PMC-11-5]GMA46762.1 central glycolytic genes regulator [Tetragenococcus muriaticus]
MLNELQLIEAIAPDMLHVLQERYRVLQGIYWMQPIGRRSLSESLALTERVLRTETDLLKKLGLIVISKSGMRLTEKGEEIYERLGDVMGQLFGMQQNERQLADNFGIDRCLIVSGDSDQQQKVIEEFGNLLDEALHSCLPNGQNIIAVMGGTTVANAAKQLTNLKSAQRQNLFVPARGGIGETVNLQANSVSAEMATRSNGTYRTLFVPEQLSAATYDSLLKEPAIVEVLNLINQANCVVHSIGRALHMAARRKMSEEDILMLKQKNAVAESFGYFFDENGKVVYKIPRVGLQLKGVRSIPYIFAVAGGKSKAKAIQAYMKNAPQQTWLITDEAAANEILRGVTL